MIALSPRVRLAGGRWIHGREGGMLNGGDERLQHDALGDMR
jgi:hypothetical protein